MDHNMMELIAAIVVLAASDFVTCQDQGAAEFLAAAGVLGRAGEIVQYAPRNARTASARRLRRAA